ncbi:hypothetical protein HPC49_46445 [Pyxidicoccus fallax]|uniref:Lipoprotein n=1 Tax=Pyxidicoccus fallax TaxID=394095 RepID=A0A848LB25_9BACT|nr:hypothetical protein [Pyxidicoccus fallax]NMO15837.1 hypothetical protein [Pyxidicoccus fallax]NPC85617.1 hypothetical protein [Pyxidicoccus fallax]
MKKFMIGLVAATSLVFGAGCGGDDNESICEDFYNSLQEVAEKGEACEEESDPVTNAEKEEAINQCKTAIESCSDEDKETLQEISDCLDDVDECKAGDEDEYGVAFFSCLFKAATLSDECRISADTDDEG